MKQENQTVRVDAKAIRPKVTCGLCFTIIITLIEQRDAMVYTK